MSLDILQYIEYGIIIGLLIWLSMKIIDKIIDKITHKVLFEYVWNKIKLFYKYILSYKYPSNIKLNYSYSIENTSIISIKEFMINKVNLLLKERKPELDISQTSMWDNTDKLKLSLIYGGYIYNLEILPFKNYMINETDILKVNIESQISLSQLKNYLINLNALNRLLEEVIKEYFINATISNGNFEIEPKKTSSATERWVIENGFEISTTLLSKDNLVIKINSKLIDFTFPNVIIDNKTITILKDILLTYYY